MLWHDKLIVTIGDICDAIGEIAHSDNAEEAKAFLELYKQHNPHAAENIGYSAGYFNRETADKIYQLFDVSHPIFGRTHPTAEEAFTKGRANCESYRHHEGN